MVFTNYKKNKNTRKKIETLNNWNFYTEKTN